MGVQDGKKKVGAFGGGGSNRHHSISVVGLDAVRAHDRMGVAPRGMALRLVAVFFGGTLVGSCLPELGDVAAYNMGIFPHIFNPLFLALGVIGTVLALFAGHRKRG